MNSFQQRRQHQQGRPAEQGHAQHVRFQERGRLAKEKLVEAGLPRVGLLLDRGEEQQAETEEDGEDQPQGAVVPDRGGADDAQDGQRTEPARDARSQQQGQRFLAARDEKSEQNARQRGVADGIADEALLAQHRVAAQPR